MKKIIYFFSFATLLSMFVSCASIMVPASSNVALTTEPTNVDVVVSDKDGTIIFKGKTPASVIMSRGHGFFDYAVYDIKLSAANIDPAIITIINNQINTWYTVGNLLSGFLVGYIIDPLTGAMWKWGKPYASQGDASIQGYIKGKKSTLHIILKEVTPEMVDELGLEQLSD